MKQQLLCFLTLFCLAASGQNIAKTKNNQNDKYLNCFKTKKINFTKLGTNQIKKILKYADIKDSNFISYRDTLDNSDTLRIAYKLKKNNYWVSFPTPFKSSFLNYKFVNMDNSGQLELVCEGEILYDTWPRGENVNSAMIIFQIDNIPTQIFTFCKSCSVLNLGGQYADDPVDFNFKRQIIIEDGVIMIGKLELNTIEKEDKKTYNQFCHITDIKPGTYKLVNGKFIKQ